MQRNVIISVLGSILIHGGLVWGGDLFDHAKEAVKKEDVAPPLEVLAMPPQEQETPEVTPEAAPETDISDLAPPSQMDVPSASVDSAFSQQMQPPPPPRFNHGGMISIPTGPAKVGAGVGNVFDLENLDQRPEARYQVPPKFPIALKRARITGSATIRFIVDTNGDVRDPVAVSSTHREFEAPAIEAVSKWRFRPGKKGNSAVNTRMEAEIEFALSNER